MRNFCKTIPALILGFAIIAASGHSQTGPSPAAQNAAINVNAKIQPKKFVDPAAAASIWNLHPRNGESTESLNTRAGKMLKELLNANPKKLNYDTDYWRLLSYLREVPLEKMPKSRLEWYMDHMPNPRLTDEQRVLRVRQLEKTPIYKMSPKDVDLYLGWMQNKQPDLRKRVVALARQNLNQPYDIYLLGEFPFEVSDPDPTFDLTHGDCVTFCELIYSMALSHDWKSFYSTLQKIRYKDGIPGMTSRNHFTEYDWDKNNSWLVQDVTDSLGATSVSQYTEKIDKARFFSNFGLGQDIPVAVLHDTYIPAAAISSVLDKLQDGDFVNIVRGVGDGVWVGHVAMIAHGADGQVHMIHSTEPKSKEQPIMDYVNSNIKMNVKRAQRHSAEFKGMKFLRLRADDLQTTSIFPGESHWSAR
jgi:hypothetical protein